MNDNFNFKKKFGQNFLKNKVIIENMVKKTDILSNSLVIEVGPGSGALTKELVKYSKYVLAYEIDNELKEVLNEEFKNVENIDFIFDDFLKRNIEEDIKKYKVDNVYFVSNVPYYISTPILFKLVDSSIGFKKIVMMVQKELGERMSATSGTRSYNALSVILSYSYGLRKMMNVSRYEFKPVPNVDSVVIELIEKQEKLKVKNIDTFYNLVKDSFQFKRKNIRNNLKKYDLEKIEKVLKKYNKDLRVRAEELPLEVFVDITNEIC